MHGGRGAPDHGTRRPDAGGLFQRTAEAGLAARPDGRSRGRTARAGPGETLRPPRRMSRDGDGGRPTAFDGTPRAAAGKSTATAASTRAEGSRFEQIDGRPAVG